MRVDEVFPRAHPWHSNMRVDEYVSYRHDSLFGTLAVHAVIAGPIRAWIETSAIAKAYSDSTQ